MLLGFTRPNPMVGCVIVKDGRVAGEGSNPKAGQPHAEVLPNSIFFLCVQVLTLYTVLFVIFLYYSYRKIKGSSVTF